MVNRVFRWMKCGVGLSCWVGKRGGVEMMFVEMEVNEIEGGEFKWMNNG